MQRIRCKHDAQEWRDKNVKVTLSTGAVIKGQVRLYSDKDMTLRFAGIDLEPILYPFDIELGEPW